MVLNCAIKNLTATVHMKGIARHKTMRMTPQQNRFAERMNRILMNKVRCMLV